MMHTFKPYVKIVEQPASKALRFRYECEGRAAGAIPGANSTLENKTCPSIEIVGYRGDAVVVISCVTKDQPHLPHPHKLIGIGCQEGIYNRRVNTENMPMEINNLGIQCVKKKDIESSLNEREKMRIDPFRTGFDHRSETSLIDLYSLRLCFQVFIEDKKGGFTTALDPVVSEPIYDKKAMSELVICRVCTCPASVEGGTEHILLCEKIVRDDILIRFYEKKNDQIIWEDYGSFEVTDVHKQTAIAFTTPPYPKRNKKEPIEVFIQLKRPSDGLLSKPVTFRYSPLESDDELLKRKFPKIDSNCRQFLRIKEIQRQTNELNISEIKQENEEILQSIQSVYQQCFPNNFASNFQLPYASKTEIDQHNNTNAHGTSFMPLISNEATQYTIHNNTQYTTNNFNTNPNLQMMYSCNVLSDNNNICSGNNGQDQLFVAQTRQSNSTRK
uniref:RHD domain-containing protein n=1 Tax=Glossina brevipalpis TaxID=37001 RepID=A0A1A9W5W7_9MUSC